MSVPDTIEIISTIFNNGGFEIVWEESQAPDFSKYELFHSLLETMDNSQNIYSTNTRTGTNFFMPGVDPLVLNYFYIMVLDTFEYFSQSEIYATSLDPKPIGVNVSSVTYDISEMLIIWEESPDGDFKHYNLLYSQSESGDKTSVTTITNKSTTSHSITEFNPNNENWYWVEVSDTLGQTSIGTGMTNSLNNQPNSVDVTSVSYDLESMTITWEEYVPNMGRIQQMNQNTRSTVTNDFVSYELLQSDNENGTYSSVVVISDQSTTSHSITEFDPTQENWFKIKVIDFWNLTSIGTGMTNSIDLEPNPVNITSVTYDLESMTVTWEGYSPNLDRIKQLMTRQSSLIQRTITNDFSSYELLYSETEYGDRISIAITNEQSTTSYSMNEFDPTHENWYWVKVTDHWGLNATGTGMTSEVDEPPVEPTLDPIDAFGSDFTIAWSVAMDDDFSHYNLYEAQDEYMADQIIIFTTSDPTENTYISLDNNYETTYYFQVSVVDYWGLEVYSNIESIDPEYITFIQHYDYGNGETEAGKFGIQTETDNYIILGSKNDDIWLLKTDEGGLESWNYIFDYGSTESGVVVKEASDMGYVVLANSNIDDDHDILIIKTNANGSEEWSHNFGGEGIDIGGDMMVTPDGGLIIVGTYNTNIGRDSDLWLLKTNSMGNEEWSITLTSENENQGLIENGYSISATSDNGYIVSAAIETNYQGPSDVWLINVDASGDTSWSTTFDIDVYDYPEAVLQTIDGGFAIAGYSTDNEGDSTGSWLIKTDGAGQQIWIQNLSDQSAIHCMVETDNGSFLLTGIISSESNIQAWLLKMDQTGVIIWEKTFGGNDREFAISVEQTSDGGFVIVGTTNSYATGSDVLHIKTDPSGNILP